MRPSTLMSISVVLTALTLTSVQGQPCTADQQNQITTLWKAAGKTSACSPYAPAGGSYFRWPCSAGACTATVKELASKVPLCAVGTEKDNERTRILNSVKACDGATDEIEDPTLAPTATDCNTAQVDKLLALFVATATNANCKSYGKVSTFSATITAPCSSPCVAVDMVSLTAALDDCYYSLDGANKKRYVKNKLNACKPVSRRRVLQSTASAGDKNVTIQVSSVYDIHGSSNSSNNAGSTTTSPPVKSGASFWKPAPATWLTSALLVLAAGV